MSRSGTCCREAAPVATGHRGNARGTAGLRARSAPSASGNMTSTRLRGTGRRERRCASRDRRPRPGILLRVLQDRRLHPSRLPWRWLPVRHARGTSRPHARRGRARGPAGTPHSVHASRGWPGRRTVAGGDRAADGTGAVTCTPTGRIPGHGRWGLICAGSAHPWWNPADCPGCGELLAECSCGESRPTADGADGTPALA
jgi:hypothetical protein